MRGYAVCAKRKRGRTNSDVAVWLGGGAISSLTDRLNLILRCSSILYQFMDLSAWLSKSRSEENIFLYSLLFFFKMLPHDMHSTSWNRLSSISQSIRYLSETTLAIEDFSTFKRKLGDQFLVYKERICLWFSARHLLLYVFYLLDFHQLFGISSKNFFQN